MIQTKLYAFHNFVCHICKKRPSKTKTVQGPCRTCYNREWKKRRPHLYRQQKNRYLCRFRWKRMLNLTEEEKKSLQERRLKSLRQDFLKLAKYVRGLAREQKKKEILEGRRNGVHTMITHRDRKYGDDPEYQRWRKMSWDRRRTEYRESFLQLDVNDILKEVGFKNIQPRKTETTNKQIVNQFLREHIQKKYEADEE